MAALWIVGAQPAHRRYRGAPSVNNRLCILRAEREWSQAAPAERPEVSRQTVSTIATGK